MYISELTWVEVFDLFTRRKKTERKREREKSEGNFNTTAIFHWTEVILLLLKVLSAISSSDLHRVHH